MPPRQIVAELDRYIVGQEAAKKAVAIAVRNRWRRAQAPDDIRDEITPYNIIMIGPTGVGKDRGGPPARPARAARRSSRSRRPSSPRWATSAATPSPWCATWWTRPSTWCAPSARTRSIPRRSSGPTSGCWTCCSPPPPPAADGEGGEGGEGGERSLGVRGRLERPGQAGEGADRRGGAAAAVAREAAGRCWPTGSSTTARSRSRSPRRATP